jgi:hypothetical protein
MATQTIACNENNDMYLVDGRNLSIISGAPACAQNLTQKGLMILGENQFNINDGVDYFGTVFTPQPNYDAARQSISKNILECPDTLSVSSLTITTEGDEFEYTAQVSTIYGPITSTNQGPTP